LPRSWCNFYEEQHEKATCEVRKSTRDNIFGKRPETIIDVLDFAKPKVVMIINTRNKSYAPKGKLDPQIHLDLEQTVTEYYSFPSSKVLNGQEKKDEVLTLGKLSLSLLILALPQCSCVVQSQQHKPITAKTLIYSKL
jgi:hypothetical protein